MSESIVNKSVLSFPVQFEKTEEFENTDTRFTKVKIWLMHTGKNLNKSSFDKKIIENAIPTLQYIPVVGFIETNASGEEDFSDHRYIITKNENGIYRKYMGTAYGVILSNEDNDVHFEMKMCEDGIEREFIVANGVIWNMFENSSNIINRDIIKDHSIELSEDSVDGYMDEEGIFHFTKFSFRAACVLGGEAQPAMTGSTVEVQFTMNDFVKNLQSELNDKYNAFTKIVSDSSFTKMVDEQTNQGGIENMANIDFAQTLLQQFEDISTMVREYETVKDRWGDPVARFYAVDVQENEVIVVDRASGYNYFGFSFTMNGDKPEIDFTSGKRKKIQYEDYVEGTVVPEGSFDFGNHISEIEEIAFAKVEEANNKVTEAETKFETAEEAKVEAEANYTQIKAEFDEIKPKYDDYVAAEQARIDAEIEAQKDAEFAKYETVLADSTEFAELKTKKSEMSVKDIEGECAILYARKNLAQANFTNSNTNKVMTAGIMDSDDNKDGFVSTKYGYIPVAH